MKKRILSFLLALSFACTLFSVTPSADAVHYPVGDVNLSGEVNADDVTALARHVGGIETLTNKANLVDTEGGHYPLGDLNLSGEAGAEDLTALARHVGGIETIVSSAYGIYKSDEESGSLLVNGENELLSYTFTGKHFASEGYAAGLVTLPAVGSYSLYWGDKNGAPLTDYFAIAEDIHEAFTFGKDIAIPAAAKTLVLRQGNVTKDTVTLPASKLISETDYMSFGSLSDVHVDYTKNAAGKFTSALNWFDSLGLDYVLISGDLSGDGTKEANYQQYYAAATASSFPYENILEARGNHDSQDTTYFLKYTATDGNGTRDSREVHPFTNSPYFYMLLDGGEGHRDNLVIMLAQELTGLSNTYYQDNLSTAQLDWFEGVLEKYAGTETNIFVLFHPLVYQYGPGDSDLGGYQEPLICLDSYPNNLRFKSILTKYREIITMSGHTHVGFEAGYNFDDEDGYAPRMIHNSSCYAVKRFFELDSLTDKDSDDDEGSEGYVARVYDSYIVYSGADLCTKTTYPLACYIFDTYSEDRSAAVSIAVSSDPDKTDYAIGDSFDPHGLEITATYADGSSAVVAGWTYDIFRTLNATDTLITVSYGDLTVTVPISVGGHVDNSFKGNGTKQSPYLIETPDDFYRFTQNMRQYVSSATTTRTGIYGVGLYFKQTADIDMTGYTDYEGIYATATRKYGFGGVYDGDGHTLTVSLQCREYAQLEVSVFPYVNGVIKNLTFAGYISAKTAQPIRAIGGNGVVVNCLSHMELDGSSTSNGLAQNIAGTVARWYCDSILHGTKRAMEGTNENGKYYAAYTQTTDGDGKAVTSTRATAVTSAADALVGFDGLDATALSAITAIDASFTAAELLIPSADGTTLEFVPMKAHTVNLASQGTAFDDGGECSSGFTPNLINDGSTSTGWQHRNSTEPGQVKYVGIMFTETKSVGAVTLTWESASRAKEHGYYVEYTVDGETWQRVPAASYRYNVSSEDAVDEVNFTPVDALGIRVVIEQIENSKYAVKLYEMDIWQA